MKRVRPWARRTLQWHDRTWHAPGWVGVGWSFVLHVATGALAVLAHYAVMALLLWGGLDALRSSAIGFVAGAAVRFVLSKKVVFRSRAANRSAMLRFTLALGAQFCANLGLLAALLWLGAPVVVAQLVTTGILTIINYLVHRLWVFR